MIIFENLVVELLSVDMKQWCLTEWSASDAHFWSPSHTVKVSILPGFFDSITTYWTQFDDAKLNLAPRVSKCGENKVYHWLGVYHRVILHCTVLASSVVTERDVLD